MAQHDKVEAVNQVFENAADIVRRGEEQRVGKPPAPELDGLFDISTFETAETSEMIVNHPVTGAPTTWIWTIAGPGHPETIKLDSERAEEMKRDEIALRRAQANGVRFKPEIRGAEEERQRTAKNFSRRVISWTPVKLNGQMYDCTRKNVADLLLDPKYFLVYRQLLDFLVDERSFMKPSSQN